MLMTVNNQGFSSEMNKAFSQFNLTSFVIDLCVFILIVLMLESNYFAIMYIFMKKYIIAVVKQSSYRDKALH